MICLFSPLDGRCMQGPSRYKVGFLARLIRTSHEENTPLNSPLKWMEGGCGDRCYREHIGYSGHCNLCRRSQLEKGTTLERVEDKVYHGETSRTLHTRAGQHRDDYLSNLASKRTSKSSRMWDHLVEEHGGVPGPDHHEDFTFRLLGSFRDSLSRQVNKAVRLEMVQLFGRVLGDRGGGRREDSESVEWTRGVFPAKDCAACVLPAVGRTFVFVLPTGKQGIWGPVEPGTLYCIQFTLTKSVVCMFTGEPVWNRLKATEKNIEFLFLFCFELSLCLFRSKDLTMIRHRRQA